MAWSSSNLCDWYAGTYYQCSRGFKIFSTYMVNFSFEDKFLTKFDEKTFFDKIGEKGTKKSPFYNSANSSDRISFIYFLPSLSGGTNWFVLLRNSAICPYAFGGSEKSGLILGAVEIVDSIVWFKVSSDVAVCGNKNNFIGSS